MIQLASHDLNETCHASVGHVPRIKQERLECVLDDRWRNLLYDGLENLIAINTLLRRHLKDVFLLKIKLLNHLLDSARDISGLQLNLVDDWNNVKTCVKRLVEV